MRHRLNPWPSVADLFSALLVACFAALVITIAAHAIESQRQKQDMTQAMQKIAELEEKLKECRSKIPPSCEEVGLIRGPLFTAKLISRSEFRLNDGSVRGIAEIPSIWESELKLARERDCRHVIHLYYGLPRIVSSGEDYHAALGALRDLNLRVIRLDPPGAR
jgi:hypothetical protein